MSNERHISRTLAAEIKSDRFRRLHYKKDMLFMPNVWNSISAALMEYGKFPAIGVSGIAIAHAHGFPDARKMPFSIALRALENIVHAVDIPVSADMSCSFDGEPVLLEEKINLLQETGIAGLGVSDTHGSGQRLFTIDEQCKRISLIRKTTVLSGRRLFINAQTDVLLHNGGIADTTALMDVIIRSRAYLEAGADGVFPLFFYRPEHIMTLVASIGCPLNFIVMPGTPKLDKLNEMGVARLDIGPALSNVPMSELKRFADELRQMAGREGNRDN